MPTENRFESLGPKQEEEADDNTDDEQKDTPAMEIDAETALSNGRRLGADRILSRPEESHQRRRVERTSTAWKLREYSQKTERAGICGTDTGM